jgi:CubicO group peptidase (beta-lactamase class C family)
LHLGAQIYVSHRGRTIVDAAIGEARPGAPMTEDTMMLWLSASKPIAAIAIAQLWERGKLALDDRVAKCIPEFGIKGKEPITLRHVLTHTGGFRTVPGLSNWGCESWEQTIARICEAPLEPSWTIGRTAGYHPMTSWFILGEVVRRVDGRIFDRYVREAVFLPLEMQNSWVGMPAAQYRAYAHRLAPIYDTSRGELDSSGLANTEEGNIMPRPGSNGRGPIRELARFYDMLLHGGELDGVRIVSPQTVDALVARHRAGLLDKTFDHVIDWGLGIIINSSQYEVPESLPYGYGSHASLRTFGHSGSQSSCAFADPDNHLVVVWACNGMPGESKHQQRQRSINGAIYQDLGLSR